MNTLGRRETSWEKAAANQWLKFCHKEHLPERRILFCVLLRDGMVFSYRILILFPLFTSDGCCNWLSRLSKISLPKKTDQKWGISCSIVSSDSATFVTCSQLWCWWSQIKQVISAPWRPTTPCCLFPCTKMVKLFPFKGNKSWCSSWDRKTARTTSK